MEQIRDPLSGEYRVVLEEHKTEAVNLSPQDLEGIAKRSEEMSFWELSDYIETVENEGYDATRYRVDRDAKTSLPPACVIFAILAAGVAVRRKARDSLPVSIAIGLFAVFVYWVIYSFSLSLGYGAIIPAPLAAWVPNFICMCFAAAVLLHAEKAA